MQLEQLLRATLPQARLEIQTLPDCPQLRLWLLNPDFSRAPLTPQQQRSVWERTAYWAFCWPAGQILARWVLDNADKFCEKTVLDLGCGSGVVAIAAARAGAARVLACDLDPDALQAARHNASLNQVHIETADHWGETTYDWVLLADVLYDPANLPLLSNLPAQRALAADCRLSQPPPGWESVGRATSQVVPDLDWHEEFRQVHIFRQKGSDPHNGN